MPPTRTESFMNESLYRHLLNLSYTSRDMIYDIIVMSRLFPAGKVYEEVALEFNRMISVVDR